MKDLNSLNRTELAAFFSSFDRILSDVDGVLWNFLESIPGTQDAISSLKKIGKKVTFVSNNGVKSLDVYHQQLTSAGFDVEKDDIITPVLAMISYLKKRNFSKEIYVVGMSPIRKELERAGFQIADNGCERIKETLGDLPANVAMDVEKIGAVIIDADVNLSYLKLQRAVTCLQKPDTLFISGSGDFRVPVSSRHTLVGPGYFHKIIADVSGKNPYSMAKPNLHLNEYIVEKLKIEEPKRVLFIGDSIPEDMGFATNSGYKKLLVLTGLTKTDAILNWKFPEEFKPDYYIDSLKGIHDLIERHFGDSL